MDLLIERFVTGARKVLGDNLLGVYLHGSAAMGCYCPAKSDLDFVVVVQDGLSDEVKSAFMEMLIKLDAKVPGKGIEMSIVKRMDCNPFVYPTPFELHYSRGHYDWYLENPADYVAKMKGSDKDLAAHFTVIRERGLCVYGIPVDEMFGEVPRQDYIDALWYDIEAAEEGIAQDTMYLTLNLARVLAYLKEGKVLSKQEGGEWGLDEHEPGSRVPEKYHPLLREALKEYRGEEPAYDMELAREYARYMLSEIKSEI